MYFVFLNVFVSVGIYYASVFFRQLCFPLMSLCSLFRHWLFVRYFCLSLRLCFYFVISYLGVAVFITLWVPLFLQLCLSPVRPLCIYVSRPLCPSFASFDIQLCISSVCMSFVRSLCILFDMYFFKCLCAVVVSLCMYIFRFFHAFIICLVTCFVRSGFSCSFLYCVIDWSLYFFVFYVCVCISLFLYVAICLFLSLFHSPGRYFVISLFDQSVNSFFLYVIRYVGISLVSYFVMSFMYRLVLYVLLILFRQLVRSLVMHVLSLFLI